MTSSAHPTPIWDVTGRHTPPTESKRLQGAHGRIGPKGLQSSDAKARRQLGNTFSVTVTTPTAGGPASVHGRTSDGQAVPVSAMPERVAEQTFVGRGGKA